MHPLFFFRAAKVLAVALLAAMCARPTVGYAQWIDPGAFDACLTFDPDAPPAGKSPSSPIADIYIDPFVHRQGETFRLMIEVRETDLRSITFITDSSGWILHDGVDIEDVELHDDGTHGDQTAGDRVFTIDKLSLEDRTGYDVPTYSQTIRRINFEFGYDSGRTVTDEIDVGLGIRSTHPQLVRLPELRRLRDDIQYTTHVVNIVSGRTRPFPDFSHDILSILTRYYEFFPHDRDFIFLSFAFPTPGAPSGSFEFVRNDVDGLGLSRWDDTGVFGSGGRLQGIIRFYYGYGGEFPLVRHELLHRWANHLDPSLGMSYSHSHWPVIDVDSSGFGSGLQASEITQVSDTTYRVREAYASNYNKLELYLMGLADFFGVSFPLRVLRDPRRIGKSGPDEWIFESPGIRNISRDEFREAVGDRDPGYFSAQRSFSAAMIVVSERLLTDEELAFFHYWMVQNERDVPSTYATLFYGGNFHTATAGRGRLTTRLSTPSTHASTDSPLMPTNVALHQNYPNPFNPATEISFSLPEPSLVRLSVGDLTGREVRVLIERPMSAGDHSIPFDGAGLASGVYVYRMETTEFEESRLMVLAK